MPLYYRIQPSGFDIKGHYSQTSNGETADGLHVFTQPDHTFYTDGEIRLYGDEIIVIETGYHWDNEDVEGVCIDPEESKIIARFSWTDWLSIWVRILGAPESISIRDLKRDYDLSDWDLHDKIEWLIKERDAE